MHWIEEHPYLTGSVVLAVIVGYFLLSSGSSSSSVASSPAVVSDATDQSQQLAASAQMQQLQNNATLTQNAINEQLAEKQIDANTSTTASNLASQVQLQNIYSSAEVADHSTDISLQLAQAQVGGQVQLATIGAASNEKIAGIQADVTNQQTAAALAAQKDIDTASVMQTQLTTSSATQQLQDQINGNLAYGKMAFDNSVDLANINAGVENNAINTQGAIDISQTQATSTLKQSLVTLLGTGILNKGGEGGSNQTSAFNDLVNGNPYAPATVQSGFGFNISVPKIGSIGVGVQN